VILVFSNIFFFSSPRFFFFLGPIVCFCFFCGACFCVSRSSSSSGSFVVAGSLIRGKNCVCVCVCFCSAFALCALAPFCRSLWFFLSLSKWVIRPAYQMSCMFLLSLLQQFERSSFFQRFGV
jgi:hypothetical protein